MPTYFSLPHYEDLITLDLLFKSSLYQLAVSAATPWAPAMGGQSGHVLTLEIIWVAIAHLEFPSLERV